MTTVYLSDDMTPEELQEAAREVRAVRDHCTLYTVRKTSARDGRTWTQGLYRGREMAALNARLMNGPHTGITARAVPASPLTAAVLSAGGAS